MFPTHSKLDGRGQLTEILIVNGLECEPYITTDDRLMQEYADGSWTASGCSSTCSSPS